ncbi:sulfurtransferase complex subunit TusB [Sphaerotilus microaerophilus]|jgi:tRNA 2-thiouridine synthesizing protein B|uniref:Multidrug MFS transporter n=1 Tax=Sphaerotilus microaerophilus TaxID=2914710 RepID=A0ABM7YTF4_9BURK|nr:sulfurtransferase complex subunit TusB [Sphaerotilus sp. FB-5]BDI07929.1 multidrug MFS transporter [Sphaerotilus sp. FB-5]
MLNIVNKSPLERNTLDSCLRLMCADGGAGDALLLIEDAVYAVTRGNAAAAKIADAMARCKVYALMPDLEARGVADRVLDGVHTVDYGGFVDLVAAHPNNQSWL